MKVELKRDTIVRFPKGTVLEVSDEEAARLIAFGNAVVIEKAIMQPSETKTRKSSKK